MTTWGAPMSCLWCGDQLTHVRRCVEHDARRVDHLQCTGCHAEFALLRELAGITPRPPSTERDERARAYRAQKKANA
jgi:hypothetical protein